MFGAIVVIFCAAMTAINVVVYAMTSSPWSLGAALFCGILTVFNLFKATMGNREL